MVYSNNSRVDDCTFYAILVRIGIACRMVPSVIPLLKCCGLTGREHQLQGFFSVELANLQGP